MSDVANSTNQIQFCLFASGGKISAPATRSLFTFPMNPTLNFPPLTGTHDATRKANLPWAVRLVLLPRLAEVVDLKDSRMKALSCRGRSSDVEGRGKIEYVVYHIKAYQNSAKNKSYTKKFIPTWYINRGQWMQLREVVLISELLGILRAKVTKGEYQLSDSCWQLFALFLTILKLVRT